MMWDRAGRAAIVDAGHGKFGMQFTRWREGDDQPLSVAISLEARSSAWHPAYRDGDNTGLVATDSMRNFIASRLSRHVGSSVSAFAHDVATSFLETYGHVDSVTVTATDAGAVQTQVDPRSGTPLHLLSGSHRRTAEVVAGRCHGVVTVMAHAVGYDGIVLLRPRGNSFTGFLRDGFTRLAEAEDRPLQVVLDIRWEYASTDDVASPVDHPDRAAVLDLVLGTTGGLASASVQHLVHTLGGEFLDRFPTVAAVRLRAENRSPIVWPIEMPDILVVSEPTAPFGQIQLSLQRER